MKKETSITQLPDGSGCFTATILSNEEALALPLKERPISHRISSEMYHDVFEHIGEASMAWSPNTGSAVFNSEMASDIALRLCFKIANELEKSTQKLQDEILESQSRLEKALADQRRNLCAESDALIEKLKQAREWVNLSATEVCSMNKPCAEYIAQIEQELMTAKLLLSTRVEASRLDDAERRFQYQKDENDNRIKQIRKLQTEEREAQRCFGMALELNIELQHKADMWRDEFERIKAICYGKSLDFLEIQGICERAMQDIRSNISIVDQREKLAEENADLRMELETISGYYNTLRTEHVEWVAERMYGIYQAAARSTSLEDCRRRVFLKLNSTCMCCGGKGMVGCPASQTQEAEVETCSECEGVGYVEIPDLAWLKRGKIQFDLLPKDHPDYDPTVE
jgi:hypothetical protein